MIILTQNDLKPSLKFYCKEDGCGEVGTVIDLTGYTVRFIFKKALGSGTYKFKRVCDVTDAVNGICVYDWQSGDLDTVGDFLGELEITDPAGKPQSNYNTISIRVKKELG